MCFLSEPWHFALGQLWIWGQPVFRDMLGSWEYIIAWSARSQCVFLI